MVTGYRRVAALVLALGLALALPAAQPDQAREEADQRARAERIQRLQRQVQQDVVEKNQQNRRLRDADRSVSKALGELTRLRAERAERSAIRRHLEAEKAEREAQHERREAELASQLRAAYFMGRNEPLKLLLNQRSPAEFSRNLTYYGYVGRLRAGQMRELTENIARIDELTAKIEEEDARLAELEQGAKAQVGELEQARKQVSRVLASLERESGSRTAQLKRLREEYQQRERALERLRRETELHPYDPKAPFAQTQKRLAWPVAGKVTVAFGAAIPGDRRSDGVQIDTEYGETVRAIHEGEVVHSDWLPGLGQVVILNHGNGYLSIYGHLGEMYTIKDGRVAAGQTIGAAGDSGGRARPGLYFEIRRNQKPVDPRGWFRTPAPPAR